MDDESYNLNEDSDDDYRREEVEQRLYSQIYHDTSGTLGASNVITLCSSNSPAKEPTDLTNVTKTTVDECSNTAETSRQDTSKRVVEYNVDSSGDDSDIQVIKEVVLVTKDSDDEHPSAIKVEKSGVRKRKISSASEDDEEMPFWSRLDSRTYSTDKLLDLHIRRHGRQRHDSIISHTSSALGDDVDPLVSLQRDEFDSLDNILDKLPDGGWEIIHTDYSISSMNPRKSLRYHNLRCHNCNERGHVSNACTQVKKQKPCSLCSEVHQKARDRRNCPRSLCTWCAQTGHPKNHCYDMSSLRRAVCQRCKQRGHRAKMCHELWRQWHATTSLPDGVIYPTLPSSKVEKKDIYCANCSFKGHSAHECKQTSWEHTKQALPVHISHYNTFGAAKDFARRWTKEMATQQTWNNTDRIESKDLHTNADCDELGPSATFQRNKAKRRKQDDQTGQQYSNSVWNRDRVSRRKERKLQKKIARRDGPLVKFPVADSKCYPSTSGLTQPQTPHSSSQSGSHTQTKAKLKSKIQQETPKSYSAVYNDAQTRKIVRNKKANERKKKRNLGIGRERREKREQTVSDREMIDLVMGSQSVKSWNDAF